MSITLDWTDILDKKIVEAISSGRVTGKSFATPYKHIETGLAHVFFAGNSVYKLYKTHSDKDHFIKGVLAPTERRTHFIEHDFNLNQHFGREIYKTLYSVSLDKETVIIGEYQKDSIHILVEMEKLDFEHNLHEQLLQGHVSKEVLYLLGSQTAELVDSAMITVPENLNWYSIAKERMAFLVQFTEWLPKEFSDTVKQSKCLDALYLHLEENKSCYQNITGSQLTVNLDNHDENIFIKHGEVHKIDVLPPMSCWWYGVPESNLSNVMVNVETMMTTTDAQMVKEGYMKYHEISTLPENIYNFTRAFSYLISVAHFGSIPEKRDVAKRYLIRSVKIPTWL